MHLTRRSLLQHLSIAGAVCALWAPRLAFAATGHEQDWQWLEGNWDVYHERLRDRLVGSTTWDKFGGKCALLRRRWAVSATSTIACCTCPRARTARSPRAPSIRRPTNGPSGGWTAAWPASWIRRCAADSRETKASSRAADVHKGTPVTVRFRWHETNSKRPMVGPVASPPTRARAGRPTGATTSRAPAHSPRAFRWMQARPSATEAADWAFLAGQWRVRNRQPQGRR